MYGKKPIWQWILIYLIIGGVIYVLIYYAFFAKKGGYAGGSLYPSTNSNDSTPVAKNTVVISNSTFSPSPLVVKAGDKVTWINKDNTGHSATADDGSFDTGVLYKGKSGSNTFVTPGTYKYHCSLHSTMRGTIVVQ